MVAIRCGEFGDSGGEARRSKCRKPNIKQEAVNGKARSSGRSRGQCLREVRMCKQTRHLQGCVAMVAGARWVEAYKKTMAAKVGNCSVSVRSCARAGQGTSTSLRVEVNGCTQQEVRWQLGGTWITMLSLITIRVGTELMVGFVAWKQRPYSRKVSRHPSAGR